MLFLFNVEKYLLVVVPERMHLSMMLLNIVYLQIGQKIMWIADISWFIWQKLIEWYSGWKSETTFHKFSIFPWLYWW